MNFGREIVLIMEKFFNMRYAFLVILIFSAVAVFSQTNPSALSTAALALTKQTVRYDASYFRIGYPNGDVPSNVGVCTDVVIRAYRKVGIDLQKLVHEDMKANFNMYPKNWGLKKTDTNIDHRRVPNLMKFFTRHGQSHPVTTNAGDYQPGDIVTWDLTGGVTHIGIVVNRKSDEDNSRYMIVHNIGAGQELEDFLFDYKITGHFRYGFKQSLVSSTP